MSALIVDESRSMRGFLCRTLEGKGIERECPMKRLDEEAMTERQGMMDLVKA